MDFPFDVLDHIFSFLVPHPGTLYACSRAHPAFSQIVEKYIYYHTIIHTGFTKFYTSFQPLDLIKILSEKPEIAAYVRVLQIEFGSVAQNSRLNLPLKRFLEDIASILPMLPLVECVVLSPLLTFLWQFPLPQNFRERMEDFLHLPTIQEVHVGTINDFPLSTLANTNINFFSVSGSPNVSECTDVTFPQLKSLSIRTIEDIEGFKLWAARHTQGLQSLAYGYSSLHEALVSDLLKGCSDTLTRLDLSLTHRLSSYYTMCDIERGPLETDIDSTPINLSGLPHLQHLTIRANIYFNYDNMSLRFFSSLPTAIQILQTVPPLRNLTIEIRVESRFATIDQLSLSILASLADISARSVHRIDLYIYSAEFKTVSHAEVVSLLAEYGLMKLIEQGVLVVHSEKTAPTLLDLYSKSTIVRHAKCNGT